MLVLFRIMPMHRGYPPSTANLEGERWLAHGEIILRWESSGTNPCSFETSLLHGAQCYLTT